MTEPLHDDQPALAPQLAGSVLMLQSLGAVVDAATLVATTVVNDVPGRLEGLDPEMRGAMLALCDAVFTADYHLT